MSAAAPFVIPSIFTAIDKLTAPVRKMTNSVQSFATKTEAGVARADRMFRKLTPGLSDASKQFLSFASTAALTGAAIAGISFSGKQIMDYETELANLQAVTGASGDAFDVFKGKIKDVANETKTSAVDVAAAFTAIANNQPALLKDADALAQVTKNSIILAQASKMELKPAGEALTQILNQFGKSAADAAQTVDILAAGSVAGSSEIRDTADAIQKFGTVAANSGIKIKEAVALIELASPFEKGAEAGTRLRNILLMLSTAKVQDPKALKDMHRLGVNMDIVTSKTLPLTVRLKEMAKVAKDDAALFHIFGKENQALATGLLGTFDKSKNIQVFDEMLKAVETQGMAAKMAAKNNETFAIKIQQLKDKFTTWIVTSDEATKGLTILKTAAGWVADHLSAIVKTVGYLVGGFVALKTILLVTKIGIIGYNVVMGIMNALDTTSVMLKSENTVAQAAYMFTTKAMTAVLWLGEAAQWALNVAMTANPVALVVLGILALVAALGYVIANYKTIEQFHQESMSKDRAAATTQEAKQVQFLAEKYEKLGHSKAESIKLATEVEKKNLKLDLRDAKLKADIAAKSGDESKIRIAEGVLNNISGKADALAQIQKDPASLNSIQDKPVVDPKSSQQDSMIQSFLEKTNNAKVDININDPQGKVDASTDSRNTKIKTTSTMKLAHS